MTSPPRKPRGRRRGESTARPAILAAARARFSADGLDATSLRAVARDADVDPALVLHYFGDKARLFAEAMTMPIDADEVVARVVTGPRSQLGPRLVTYFLDIWDDPARRERLTGLLKASMTSPAAAELLRDALAVNVLQPIGERLPAEGRELRTSLCSTQLVGLAVARYIVRLEPLASLPPDAVVALVGPALQRHLTGRL